MTGQSQTTVSTKGGLVRLHYNAIRPSEALMYPCLYQRAKNFQVSSLYYHRSDRKCGYLPT